MKALKMALALAIAGACPSWANNLPQGQYMLAAQVMPDEMLTRYVTLSFEADRVDVIVSSLLPLDLQACEADRSACTYREIVASAVATLSNGEMELSEITINTDAVLEEQFRFDAPLYTLITEPLLERLSKTRFEETEHGFTLISDGTALPFYSATEEAQNAIMVFPFMMEMSIRTLGGCEVAAIAPMFAQDGAVFPDVLRAQTRVHNLIRQADELDPISREASEVEQAAASAAMRLARLPSMIAFLTDPGDLETRIETLWNEGPGSAMFGDNRSAFDGALDQFGPELGALVDFMTHFRTTGVIPDSESACTDPSFGFIAAQGG